MSRQIVLGFLLALAATTVLADSPGFTLGQSYQCANGRSFKLLSCAPDGSVCDMQLFNEQGQPAMRGKSTRAQILDAVAHCPAKGAGGGTAAAGAAPRAAAPVAAAAPARAAPGGPPKPGLASCAGKFEGRYGLQAGTGGMLTVTFHSDGKATVREPDAVMTNGKLSSLSSERDAQCWYGGGHIYLRWLNGDTDSFPIDINDDGTLDMQYGELKRKGS